MPELPEVETIKRGLAKNIIGKKIIGFERRAKMLIIGLSDDWRLWFHLKLTGQLVFSGKNKKVVGGHPIKEGFEADPNRFTHAPKFGWVRLYKKAELENKLAAMKLGPEPLDKNFTLDAFKQILKKK